MKRIRFLLQDYCFFPLSKILIFMKLTTFFLLISLASFATSGYSQGENVTIKLEDSNLKEFFSVIEKQTSYKFLYRDDVINGFNVNINEKDKPLDVVLSDLFSGTRLSFKLMDHNLVVIAPVVLLQQHMVAGTVTDNSGVPLPGVNVILKGTLIGTITDAQGRFSINSPDRNGILVFTFIGYTTQEVGINGRNVVGVELAEELTALSEVVVTALGIKREARSLGYTTASVDNEAITAVKSINVGTSLVGKVAGLDVSTQPTGPGGSSKIRIRGQSSFGADNSPLIVVNGVPIFNETTGTANTGSDSRGFNRTDNGDGLQSINPDDIESMTVLKGAAAAVLYGFRAKDGAILITTKSGARRTGIGIEISSSFQVDRAIDMTDFQYEYGLGENGVRPATVAAARYSGTWSFGESFATANGAMTPSLDGLEHPYLPYMNRVRDFYRDALRMTNSVSASGGGEKVNYHFGFSNTDAKGIIENSDIKRKILNLGLTMNPTENLTISLNANYSNENNHNPPGVGQQAWNVNQTLMTLGTSTDIRWLKEPGGWQLENGTEAGVSRFASRTNPYWIINRKEKNVQRDRLFGNASVRYQFAPWLYIQGRVGQDWFSSPEDENSPTGTINNGALLQNGTYNGSFYRGTSSFRETNLDFLVGASHKIGVLGIDATFGGNTMDQVRDRIGGQASRFYVRDLYLLSNGVTQTPSYSYSHKRVNSLYGTFEVSLKSLLFLNFSGRNDWFSTLNPESNNYFYPAVSTSFVFTEVYQARPQWLDFGKLRLAYAEVGGDTNPYGNSLYYGLSSQSYPVQGVSLGYGSISGGTTPNPNLRPLKIKEFETGIELRAYKSRVNLDFSYYIKHSVDEILNVTTSPASGYTSTRVNVGELKTRVMKCC
jgi:TonB-linked SusC/RagA family outer membrane protein